MQIDIYCSGCRKRFLSDIAADEVVCSECGRPMPRGEQLAHILERWYYPRRWYRDVARPSVKFLLEKLWTADGQGERLYAAVSPPNTNYESFVHQVTRAIVKGVDEGWAQVELPEDPFGDNPVYKLNYLDSERFADSVAALFPTVNWEETITVEEAEESKV